MTKRGAIVLALGNMLAFICLGLLGKACVENGLKPDVSKETAQSWDTLEVIGEKSRTVDTLQSAHIRITISGTNKEPRK